MFPLTFFLQQNGDLPYGVLLNMVGLYRLFPYTVWLNLNCFSSTDKSQKPASSEWTVFLHVLLHLLRGACWVDAVDLYSTTNTHTCVRSAVAAGTTGILHHGLAHPFVLPSLHFVCHLCFLYLWQDGLCTIHTSKHCHIPWSHSLFVGYGPWYVKNR